MTESYQAHADYVLYWSLISLRDEAQPNAAGDPGARLRDALDARIAELAPRVRRDE